MKKKISLTPSLLDKNIDRLNDFLGKKGMSKILGGKSAINQEIEWGNTNYSESTRPIRRVR